MAMRYIDAYCASGSLCGEYLQSLGVKPERITYGHMVADVDGIKKSSDLVSTDDIESLQSEYKCSGFTFLYAGRLVKAKGIGEMLESWRVFSKNRSDCTMIVVGDGPERESAEQFCEKYNLDSVKFAGAVDYDSIAAFYAIADCIVMPTLEDNWSLVVPEAMACGLPVLCSIYNGCYPELIREGKNGWAFDPLDISGFVEVLKNISEQSECRQRMGAVSVDVVENHTALNAAGAIYSACSTAKTDYGVDNG
jgi:glycosyltransferase involved in cell wall biosynthesis